MLPAAPTPLVRLGNIFPGREVYAKCEFAAPSGSFKIRGALHLLERLVRQGRPRRLVVPSMGNTALGAAVGARAFGFSVVGVVPHGITRDKDEKLQALGVELIKVEYDSRELLRRAAEVARERDAYFVHPHLDPLWTDSYGAIAEEVLHDLPACRTLVFPVGGGGLLMGLTAHFREHPAPVRLIACETYNFPTYARYCHERRPTVADGLVLGEPHPEVRERIAQVGLDIQLVSDDAIRAAMRELYWRQGLVVEPSSAITVAWVAAHAGEALEPVCAVLTGGNISREDFGRLIAPDGAP
jgi:threonine dehydratase